MIQWLVLFLFAAHVNLFLSSFTPNRLFTLSDLHHRCHHCTQCWSGHRAGRLHHQEAEAGGQRVGQAGHDLQRGLSALLLHTLHRGLREHQSGRNQHSLHHRVRTNEGPGLNHWGVFQTNSAIGVITAVFVWQTLLRKNFTLPSRICYDKAWKISNIL